MGKHAGAYKSEKRKKELSRIKKREEKRKKRLTKPGETEIEAGTEMSDTVEDEEGAVEGEAPEIKETQS